MILHVMSVALLGSMCVAQGTGASQGMGPQGRAQRDPQTMSQDSSAIDRNTPSSMSSDSMKSPDQVFMMKAAQGGMAEVAMGNIAKQNGGSDAVKSFGDRMVADHTQASNELHKLAQQKGITLPTGVSAKDKRMSKMLEAKQGSDFDKAYVRDMVKDHETDVAEFRREAENGKDPDVKAWAQKTLPVLEQHLATAQQIASQVGADTTKKSASAMGSQQ